MRQETAAAERAVAKRAAEVAAGQVQEAPDPPPSFRDDFAKAVSDAKAKIKDLDSLKANFPGIGKACGGCHETFRVKNG